MSISIPANQIRYKNHLSIPIMTALGMTFIYGLILIGAIWFGTSLPDLILPMGILAFFWIVTVGIVSVGAGFSAWRERSEITNLFAEPAWAAWQYSPQEWQQEYEARHRGDKMSARAGLSNLVVGPVVGGVLIAAGFFYVAEARPFLIFIGVLVGLAITALGFVNFFRGQMLAAKHLAEAQQTPSPYLIFGKMGLYHQGTGYQSLRNLSRIDILSPNYGNRMDQFMYNSFNKLYGDMNLPILRFHVWTGGGRGGRYRSQITVPIPERYQDGVRQLIERYNNERKMQRGWFGF